MLSRFWRYWMLHIVVRKIPLRPTGLQLSLTPPSSFVSVSTELSNLEYSSDTYQMKDLQGTTSYLARINHPKYLSPWISRITSSLQRKLCLLAFPPREAIGRWRCSTFLDIYSYCRYTLSNCYIALITRTTQSVQPIADISPWCRIHWPIEKTRQYSQARRHLL